MLYFSAGDPLSHRDTNRPPFAGRNPFYNSVGDVVCCSNMPYHERTALVSRGTTGRTGSCTFTACPRRSTVTGTRTVGRCPLAADADTPTTPLEDPPSPCAITDYAAPSSAAASTASSAPASASCASSPPSSPPPTARADDSSSESIGDGTTMPIPDLRTAALWMHLVACLALPHTWPSTSSKRSEGRIIPCAGPGFIARNTCSTVRLLCGIASSRSIHSWGRR